MVQGDVVDDCDAGLEKRNRAIALVQLTDKKLAVADPGAGKRRAHINEVLHIRAVHDRRAHSGAVQNPAEHADRSRLTARAGDTDAPVGRVEEFGEKPSARDDGGTNTARRLQVGDRVLYSGGLHQDLTGPRNAAAILGMQKNTTCTQKIESFGIASLVERPVRTLNRSTHGLDDQSERSHATTADAAKKVVSESGHRRNLEGLSMRCNAGWTLG